MYNVPSVVIMWHFDMIARRFAFGKHFLIFAGANCAIFFWELIKKRAEYMAAKCREYECRNLNLKFHVAEVISMGMEELTRDQFKGVRTDLALEVHEKNQENIRRSGTATTYPYAEGVEVTEDGNKDIHVTRVRITSPAGEKNIGKPMGNYITLDVPRLKENDRDLYEMTCRAVAFELQQLLKLKENDTVLVVGLGNWNITPDALGPKVVSYLMVTRHLHEYLPEQIDDGVRPVCAIAPGVLGLTGIETSDIVQGVVNQVRPALVIAIDSLASRKMNRINTTIQIADTGISPGSGVGNRRGELSEKTLGVPVIAIGVPTVVDAATMANDTIELVIDSLMAQSDKGSDFYRMLKEMDQNEKYDLIREVLEPYGGNLVVTPKEMDEVIDRVSKVIANGINLALHRNIGFDDIDRYLQ
ncbi:GPR endopeptidase [Thermoclostridium stercorarium]|jgi:spore protease